MSTIDSVWINLLIDGKKDGAYLFGANRKRTWSAKERFVITMGTPAALLSIKRQRYWLLGKRGAVVRNMVITETNLTN